MSDFCSAHGDRMVASNFVEQLGFHSDRIVIEQYRNYQGRLPSLIIRIGWSQEPADPRDPGPRSRSRQADGLAGGAPLRDRGRRRSVWHVALGSTRAWEHSAAESSPECPGR